MKKLIALIVGLVLVVFCPLLLAKASQSEPKSAPLHAPSATVAANTTGVMHIAVLDVPRVLQSIPQMEVQADTLKKRFKPRQDELTDLQQKLAADENKFRRDGTIMTKAELSNLENKINAQRRDFRRLQDNYREDVQVAQKEAMDGILKKIDAVVLKVAKQQHYDLVMQRSTIAYASPRVDISDQIIGALKG